MSQPLPPLNALRAFEATARHLSFSKAAEELHVTTAAVSHQIKGLEDYLGFTLFIRHSRSIELTDAAEQCLTLLSEGFDRIAAAVQTMREHVEVDTLNLWTTASFASKWLIPRLHRYSARFPNIDMHITSNVQLINLANGPETIDRLIRAHNADVVIRFGSGNYPAYEVDRLFDVEAVPLCSPRLLDATPYPLRSVTNLGHHTLLHDETDYRGRPAWSNWLARYPVDGVDVKRGLHFNHILMAMEAAIDAQGVLLGMDCLARGDIAEGRLCIPFDKRLPLEHAFHVVRPRATGRQYAIDGFVEWLLEETAQENAAISAG